MTASLLVALWVSILQALAGPPATLPNAAIAHRAPTAAQTSVRRSVSRPVHDALHVSRAAPGVVSPAGDAPVTHRSPASPVGSPLRAPRALLDAAVVGERAPRASHAVAARGAVLPYFATAPPLQG